MVVWALLYYPHPREIGEKYEDTRAFLKAEGLPEQEERTRLDELDRLEAGEYQRNSVMGRMGHFIEPAVKPLGWDWRIGMAAIASFPAREVVVSTLRIIYDLGEGEEDEALAQKQLAEKLQSAAWPDGRKVYSLPVALGIMVFFALCAQCASTLVTIKKESGSWKWSAVAFAYMTTLAYIGALLTYQIGSALLG